MISRSVQVSPASRVPFGVAAVLVAPTMLTTPAVVAAGVILISASTRKLSPSRLKMRTASPSASARKPVAALVLMSSARAVAMSASVSLSCTWYPWKLVVSLLLRLSVQVSPVAGVPESAAVVPTLMSTKPLGVMMRSAVNASPGPLMICSVAPSFRATKPAGAGFWSGPPFRPGAPFWITSASDAAMSVAVSVPPTRYWKTLASPSTVRTMFQTSPVIGVPVSVRLADWAWDAGRIVKLPSVLAGTVVIEKVVVNTTPEGFETISFSPCASASNTPASIWVASEVTISERASSNWTV